MGKGRDVPRGPTASRLSGTPRRSGPETVLSLALHPTSPSPGSGTGEGFATVFTPNTVSGDSQSPVGLDPPRRSVQGVGTQRFPPVPRTGLPRLDVERP